MEKERLSIRNFLSIKEFDWEIKDFNILTGDMGVGKSLCFKLLYFFQHIFNIIFDGDEDFAPKNITFSRIQNSLNEEFCNIFFLDNSDFTETNITYLYEINQNKFEVILTWDNKENILKWECDYIKNNISKWKKLPVEDSPEELEERRRSIFQSISDDYDEKLPISVTFLPASRAFMSLNKEDSLFDIEDLFFRRLSNLTGYLERNYLKNSRNFSDESKRILHIKNIIKKANKNIFHDTILLELPEGRHVSLPYASSGQQELFYLLWIIDRIEDFDYRFTSVINSSLFVEEPSTHLFPKEQKEIIEFIVKNLQKPKKKKKIRFFISTHSPYVLNVINNMLDKGNLMKRFPDRLKEIESEANFPHLTYENISAFFIDSDGKVNNMLHQEDGDCHLYQKEIFKISKNINDDTNILIDLNNQFINEGK